MKTIIDIMTKAAATALLAVSALSLEPSAFGQATTQVFPRQYTVLSSVLLGPKQYLNTNNTGTNLPYAGWTNTFIPFSGAHAIGLTGIVQTTNNLSSPSGASNVVVTVYPAYDLGGGDSNTISSRYGTNFSSTPLLVWTISYTTNGVFSTNLPTALWEPATALAYTVSNGINSNTTFTLVQAVAP